MDADPAFWAAFGGCKPGPESAMTRFFDWLDARWRGGALTPNHADLHQGQLLIAGGVLFIVDWERTAAGPLYLDLPKVFTTETAGIVNLVAGVLSLSSTGNAAMAVAVIGLLGLAVVVVIASIYLLRYQSGTTA